MTTLLTAYLQFTQITALVSLLLWEAQVEKKTEGEWWFLWAFFPLWCVVCLCAHIWIRVTLLPLIVFLLFFCAFLIWEYRDSLVKFFPNLRQARHERCHSSGSFKRWLCRRLLLRLKFSWSYETKSNRSRDKNQKLSFLMSNPPIIHVNRVVL